MKSHSKYILPAALILLLFLSLSTSFATDSNLDANTTLSATQNTEEVLTANEGTFTELSQLINSTSTGTISLNKSYKAGSGESEIVITDKTLTINGNGNTLDGNYMIRIFNITNSTVTLNNIRFINGNTIVNGGAITIDSNSTVTINKSIFENNYAGASGGAIYCNGTKSTITQSNFTSNNAFNLGGAICWTGANGTIANSTFTNNTANQGGAIRGTGANTTIANSTFTNNTATNLGGAVFWNAANYIITNSTFTQNTATQGGAIRLTGANDTVSNSTFTQNTAATGGAIFRLNGENSTVTGSTFTNNTANQGGAIHWQGGANMTIANSTFTQNKANKGGAINNNVAGTVIDACEFTFNTPENIYNTGNSYVIGGTGNFTELQNLINTAKTDTITLTKDYTAAPSETQITINKKITINGNGNTLDANHTTRIFNITNSTVTLNNIRFINGNTTESGGAITIDSTSTVTINKSIFENNYAGASGGAIYCNGTKSTITQSNFTSNNAFNLGGAICWDGANGTIANSTFTNNTANQGGAIRGTGANTTIANSTFTNNTASNLGGAVFWNAANCIITNSSFTNNTAANQGGAIRLAGANGTVSNSTFTQNTAKNGGAIYRLNGENSTVTGSTFTNNNATSNGGAIHWNGGENGTIANSTFTNNNATSNGGAIYNNIAGTVIDACEFTYNTPEDINGKNVVIAVGNFTELQNLINTATDTLVLRKNYTAAENETEIIIDKSITINGNGNTLDANHITRILNITNSTVKLNNIRFINGNTTESGGAITIDSTSTVTITNSTFINNTATNNGGAIYWNGENGTITGSTFINNTALNYRNIRYNPNYIPKLIEGNTFDLNATVYTYNLKTIGSETVRIKPDNGVNIDLNDALTMSIKLDDNSPSTFIMPAYGSYDYALTVTSTGTHTITVTLISSTGNNNYNSLMDSWSSSFKVGNGVVTIIHVNSINTWDYAYSVICGGGSIIIDDGTYTDIINKIITFDLTITETNNAILDAQQKGNIFNIENGIVHINGLTFKNGLAEVGGAINWNSANGTINNSTFINNNATYGGAINWNSTNGTVTNSTFTQNNAAINGGAINWNSTNGTVTNSTFTQNNAATNGGAINWAGGANGTITQSNFASNNAFNLGGAICWNGANGTIANSTFTNNTANQGGAIRGTGANTTIANSTFTNNTASNLGGAIFWNAANCIITNSTFTQNTANQGGAIRSGGANGTVSNSTFTQNTANQGGAIYRVNGENSTVTGSTFTNNTAKQDGGAIRLQGGENGTIANSTFTNNNANQGGAIFFNAANCMVTNSTFTNNNATNGGAICNNVAGTVINGNIFTSNNATNSRNIYNNKISILSNNVLDVIGEINATNTTYGGNVTVSIKFNYGVNNYELILPLYIQNSDDAIIIKNLTISDELNFNISDLNADDYTLILVNTDENGNVYDTLMTTFTVEALNPNLTVNIGNITVTENANVVVSSTLDSGSVLLVIDNKYYYLTLKNCSAEQIISNLKAGNYTAVVYLIGNNNIQETLNTTKFTVSKKTPTISVSASNINVGSSETIKNTVTSGATGKVNITVNGTSYIVNPNTNLVLSNLTAGTYSVTMTFLGDDTYNSATKTTTFTVSKLSSTTSVSASAISVGETAVVTVTVTSTATGNVTVKINGTTQTVALVGNTAKAYFTGLPAGTHSITVNYLGDNKYNPSSKTGTLTVNKISGGIISVVATNTSVGGQSLVTVTVAKDFSGNVNIGGTNVAASNGVSSRLLTKETAAGSKSVTVSISGNSKYADTTTSSSYVVAKGNSSISISGATNTTAGTAITITLTTTGSTSTPTVTINGKSYTVSSKKVTITTGLDEGNYTIIATLPSNNNYESATNTTVFTVIKNNITVSMASVSNAKVGTPVTLTANLGASVTGDVIFNINGASYTVAVTNNNKATYSYTPVNNSAVSVTATFAGNNLYNSKTSSAITFTPAKLASTTSVGAVSTNYGEGAEITVTVTSGATGNVNITVGSTTKTVALSSSTAKAYFTSLTTGGTITAKYLGDDKYSESTGTNTLTVNKVSGGIISVIATNTTVGGQSRVTVTLPKDYTGNVNIGGTNVAVSNGVASRLLNAESSATNSKSVTVSINGNSKYADASTSTNYRVDKGTSSISISGATSTTAGTSITITLTTTGSTSTPTVTINGKSYTVTNKKVTITNGLTYGNYTVVASLSADSNYNAATNTTSFTVTKAVSNVHVSAQNTQTTKNTLNPNKIAKNNYLLKTSIIKNTKKYNTTTQSPYKSKNSYSIAITNNTQKTNYNGDNTYEECFMQKHIKSSIIFYRYLTADNNDLNSQNTKTTYNNFVIPIISIRISQKLKMRPISIVRIKIVLHPLIAKILIAKSIKTSSKLNKTLIYYDYLDNSLIDK